ncbi:MAG: TolC family protein [Nitrospinota bacterium]|nr:TolC family protein [Nitrospinota bacterium]
MLSSKIKIRIYVLLPILIFAHPRISQAEATVSQRTKQIREMGAIFQDVGTKEDAAIDENTLLGDYIRIGLRNNRGLRASFYEWESSFKKVSQAFSLPDPMFTVDRENGDGMEQESFAISQNIPLPDKLWIRKKRAFKASEVFYHNFEQKRLNLIYEISDAYYEYLYLSKLIVLTEENIKLLISFEHVAQAKYRSALTKQQDLLKVQVELGKLENELLTLVDSKKPLEARLNSPLNLPTNNALPFPKESLEELQMEDRFADVEQLNTLLIKNNPEVLALSSSVEKGREELKLAKRDFIPDLTVGVSRKNSKYDTGNSSEANMIALSINIPIWVGRLTSSVQDARASLKASENMFRDKEFELSSKLSLVHYKLRDALRQSSLYKTALLPKAEQTLNSIRSGYEGGGVEFLSLIDAQRTLLDFQSAYYRQNANFYQRLAELKTVLGETSEERKDKISSLTLKGDKDE